MSIPLHEQAFRAALFLAGCTTITWSRRAFNDSARRIELEVEELSPRLEHEDGKYADGLATFPSGSAAEMQEYQSPTCFS